MQTDSIISKSSKNNYKSGPFERILVSPATARVVDFLLAYDEFDYSESDIARHTELSFKTVSRTLRTLSDQRIVRFTRLSGQAKMFKINKPKYKDDPEWKYVRGIHQFFNDRLDLARIDDDVCSDEDGDLCEPIHQNENETNPIRN